jgi:hypothetical protein
VLKDAAGRTVAAARYCERQTDPKPTPEVRRHLTVLMPGFVAGVGLQAMRVVMGRVGTYATLLPADRSAGVLV